MNSISSAIDETDAVAVSVSADLRSLHIQEFLCSREIAENTRKAYRRELERFVAWTDQPWHSMTQRDIERYKDHLKQQKTRKRLKRGVQEGDRYQEADLSAATIGRAIAALQSFFKWLTVKDYISKNPTLTVEKPRFDPLKPKELKESEVKALYAALQYRGKHEFRDAALLRVLEHGLRASEVVALNVSHYDGVRLHILQAKAGSVGSVPLFKAARKALDAYLGWRLEQGNPFDQNSPLFLSHALDPVYAGKRLSYAGVYRIIEELAELAGVENCHPHRLRHSFATMLVLKGMDIALARKLTRHASEKSFERYSQRAMEIEAEKQFYEVLGEEHPEIDSN